MLTEHNNDLCTWKTPGWYYLQYFDYDLQLCTFRFHQDNKSIAFHYYCSWKENKSLNSVKLWIGKAL